MNEETDKQTNINLRPWLWKKGQSGNLKGRPKGKTMKEYVRDYLSRMNDEERDEWLEGIAKIDIFKMAEGNPETKTDITTLGEKIALGTVILPAKDVDTMETPDKTDASTKE